MNIPEILVANGTGAVLVCFLFLLRVRGESKNSVGTELFCRILVVTLLAQATETISFLLDGVPGAASRFWLYLTNTVCTGATVCVGYAWCLYVDFRVYRSIGRLRKRHLLLGAPLLALLVLMVANLFGTGWIFSISADNVYRRGPLNILLYLLLFGATPRVFYVSEFGWVASMIFLRILQATLSGPDERAFRCRVVWLAPLVGVPLLVFFRKNGVMEKLMKEKR